MALALITGASSGIGLELAKLFAADTHDLVLVARSERRMQELAAQLEKAHRVKVRALAVDLGKPGAAAEIVRALGDTRVDVLVNNAGSGLFGRFTETALEKELAMIQVNIVALTELTKLVVGKMVARKAGRILNLASTAAFLPGPDRVGVPGPGQPRGIEAGQGQEAAVGGGAREGRLRCARQGTAGPHPRGDQLDPRERRPVPAPGHRGAPGEEHPGASAVKLSQIGVRSCNHTLPIRAGRDERSSAEPSCRIARPDPHSYG